MVYSQKFSKDGAFTFITGGDWVGLLIYFFWSVLCLVEERIRE